MERHDRHDHEGFGAMEREPGEITVEARVDPVSGSWKARPVLAWITRAGLVVVPLIASWLSVRYAVRLVPRPETGERTIVWVAGAIALSILVHQLVRRMLRRFSSLGVLFSLSLTFPDAAPSRLRASLRAGRVEDLQQRLGAGGGGDLEPQFKARRLADLVTTLNRREMLRTRGHSDRVRAYSEMIGAEIGLDDADLHRLRWATLLHDVGMLDVPSRILDTSGPLDEHERAVMEQHPVHAIGYLEPFEEWLGPWVRAATEHHERWDGAGYPTGLAGDEISLAGRIVAVADAYESMTGRRPYRKSRSPAAARQELVDNAGSQFDPEIVRAFLRVGIRRSRAGFGSLGALIELPAQVASLGPGVAAGAGAATAVAIVASTVVAPAISTDIVIAPPAVERLVEEQPVLATTTVTVTVPEPSTTTAPRRTTSTTSTTTTSATAEPPTTTTAAPTPIPTTATAPPATTTTVPPTSTTTTTTAPPAYPTVPTTTATPYPTTGP